MQFSVSCACTDIVCALLSGSGNAEDVSLVEIKHRLRSLVAQLDDHPALAMEQHRAEPGSCNTDMHADDSAQRPEVADTHDDVDKQYVAGMQRLALLVQHCTPWMALHCWKTQGSCLSAWHSTANDTIASVHLLLPSATDDSNVCDR